jgi:hypothetical protein
MSRLAPTVGAPFSRAKQVSKYVKGFGGWAVGQSYLQVRVY